MRAAALASVRRINFAFAELVICAATVSIRHVDVMYRVTGLLKQQQRAGHVELDIVRVRTNRDGSLVHVLGLFPILSCDVSTYQRINVSMPCQPHCFSRRRRLIRRENYFMASRRIRKARQRHFLAFVHGIEERLELA